MPFTPDQHDLGSVPVPLPDVGVQPFGVGDPQYSPHSHLPVRLRHGHVLVSQYHLGDEGVVVAQSSRSYADTLNR